MAQAQTMMTLDEKFAIAMKAHKCRTAGNEAEEMRIMMQELPMPPYLAKIAKEKMGADFLIKSGWNLTEAEAEFGSGWLTK